jgi:ribosomal protein S18 acetylase RimI-like enzyme
MLSIRPATSSDLETVFTFTRALNDHEQIEISDHRLRAALRLLVGSPEVGTAYLIERDGRPIGHAIVTDGFDLEYDGRDAYLTELWIDPEARGGGAASEALDRIFEALGARGVNALHLQVRPENPALRLYERKGFALSPRRIMTRWIRGPVRD